MWKLRRNELQRKAQLEAFDADNNLSAQHNIFGLPFTEETAALVLLPVPWEVTVSYRDGAAAAPRAIRRQSHQIDLFDRRYGTLWQQGIHMRAHPDTWQQAGNRLRERVRSYQDALEGKQWMSERAAEDLRADVNAATSEMVAWVAAQTQSIWEAGKIPAVVGGDHSTPLGAMQFLRERHPGATLLQIDAHADLREAFEGFVHSHASVMFHALQGASGPGFEKLVQVGVRDFCEAEYQRIQEDDRIICFFDQDMKTAQFEGATWSKQCGQILEACGREVYLSVDIDGLQAWQSLHTGTPVPGGLTFEQLVYLMHKLVDSGRRIIGFDLCEVGGHAQHEWDAIVGARLLYQMALATLQGLEN